MNENDIKTRLGYILQNIVAEALERAGYNYVMDPQYDPTCEIPDFLIPDEKNPKYLLEVHQTEARNSFQMKTLRAFTAVVEGKAHYGNDLISVNVLFGDPDNELPPANVRAMCSFFDANLIPRQHVAGLADMFTIEQTALVSASTEGKTISDGSKDVIADCSAEIDSLVKVLNTTLSSASARADMSPLWEMERKRIAVLGESPLPGDNTYYKRVMLKSLYLNDDDFNELVDKRDPALCSQATLQQLMATSLVNVVEEIDGDKYALASDFDKFITDPDARHLRDLCKARLDSEPAMHWFFEDIRDRDRRKAMAEKFCQLAAVGDDAIADAFRQSFRLGSCCGIEHYRCWIADLMPLALDLSHNYFNKKMYGHPKYSLRLGNPYNNIAIRSDRLGMDPDALDSYQEVALDVFFTEVKERGILLSSLDSSVLEDRIFRFRMDAAIKLRKLDPLFLVSDEICVELNLIQEKVAIRSIVGDLAKSVAAGNFKAWKIKRNDRTAVMMNAVAVHDNHGDDKSKEWGARRLATIYRLKKGRFSSGEYDDAIFILDGEWAAKDVRRLYRDGWNHICRLGDLEDKLKEIFEL